MSLITYEAIREAQRAEQAEQLQKLPEGFFDAVKNWIDYKKSKGDDMSLREIESGKKLIEDIINRRQRKLLVYAIGTVRGDLPPEGLDADEEEFFEACVSLIKEFRSRLSDKILTDDGMVQKRLSEVSEIIGDIGKREEVISEENTDINENPEQPKAVNPVVETQLINDEKAEEIVPETKNVEHEIKEESLLTPKIEEEREEPKVEPQQDNLLLGSNTEQSVQESTQPEPVKKGLKLLVDLPKFVGGNLNAYGPFKAGEIIQVPDDVKKLLLMRKVVEEIV
jgi:DNA replication initiation complex subunit (GINS family)